MRSNPSPTESVEPDSVGSGPRPKTTAPAARPATTVTATRTASNVMADAYFARTRRVRRTGRRSR